MGAPREAAVELQGAIYRMVTSFRRQRGEFGGARHADYPALAARHVYAASLVADDGPLTVGALAERLHIELTTASTIVTELEKAGIFRRGRDPLDRRRILVAIEPKAASQLEMARNALLDPLETAVAKLTEEELTAFIRGLTVYADALDASEPVASPDVHGRR